MRQNTQITKITQRKKWPKLTAQWTHPEKKSRLERTDRAWSDRLLRHPASKWSGSILSTPEPARGCRLDCDPTLKRAW